MSEASNGSVKSVAGTITAILAIVGGMAAVVIPMQHDLDTLREEIRGAKQALHEHEQIPTHSGAASVLASIQEQIAGFKERFAYNGEKIDANGARIDKLDESLQREMRLVNDKTDERLTGAKAEMAQRLACDRELLETQIAELRRLLGINAMPATAGH